MDEKFRREVVSSVEKSMKTENFSKMKIDLTGTNKKGEGFMTDFIFATVTETDKDNEYKEINLALKIGKRGAEFRENLPAVGECYKREACLYDTILPAFRQFQLQKNILKIFDAVPKCYGTVISDDIEVLVLEDLKKKGFVLHDKLLPMNLPHLHLVLKNYAKFHALSFAFRDRQRDEFNKVTANYYPVMTKLIPSWCMAESDPKLLTVLREAGRDDLAEKYVEDTKNDELARVLAVINDIPQESVINHGDCHNNNFLFQYEGNDEENPLRVAIVDWQISGIHSPAMDLSYFLFSTASKREVYQLEELLKFYHSHLTDFMKQLGSDAQKVFPYSTLLEHWRKYSIFGLVCAKTVVHLLHIREDSTPVITGKKEADQHVWRNLKLQNEHSYRERVISIVDKYFIMQNKRE